MGNDIKFEPSRLAEYTDQSILDEIKRVIDERFDGSVPARNLFDQYARVKSQTIRKRFGSWANALKQAGYNYTGVDYTNIDLSRDKYNKNRMIKDLERVKHLNNGEYFTYDFYKIHNGAYSIKTLKKHLGYKHWQDLLQSELSLHRKPKRKIRYLKTKNGRRSEYTEEQLITELKRVWDELGRRPTYSEFREIGQIGTKVYERSFGSWTKAVQKFCEKFQYQIQGKSFTTATPDILLSELKLIAQSVQSGILSYKNYKAYGGTYSIGTFQKHFGSWQDAVEKIGFKNGHAGKYSTEELFTEMQNLWERLGKEPTYKEMNKLGAISGKAYQNRFGSWSKAIHAFCSDRESDDKEYVDEEKQFTSPPKEHIPEVIEQSSSTPTKDYIIVTTPRTPSVKLRFRVLSRDAFKCVYCGKSPATHPGLILEVDHKIPYSKGGETILENLQTLCSDCNRGKSDSISHE